MLQNSLITLTGSSMSNAHFPKELMQKKERMIKMKSYNDDLISKRIQLRQTFQ